MVWETWHLRLMGKPSGPRQLMWRRGVSFTWVIYSHPLNSCFFSLTETCTQIIGVSPSPGYKWLVMVVWVYMLRLCFLFCPACLSTARKTWWTPTTWQSVLAPPWCLSQRVMTRFLARPMSTNSLKLSSSTMTPSFLDRKTCKAPSTLFLELEMTSGEAWGWNPTNHNGMKLKLLKLLEANWIYLPIVFSNCCRRDLEMMSRPEMGSGGWFRGCRGVVEAQLVCPTLGKGPRGSAYPLSH